MATMHPHCKDGLAAYRTEEAFGTPAYGSCHNLKNRKQPCLHRNNRGLKGRTSNWRIIYCAECAKEYRLCQVCGKPLEVPAPT